MASTKMKYKVRMLDVTTPEDRNRRIEAINDVLRWIVANRDAACDNISNATPDHRNRED